MRVVGGSARGTNLLSVPGETTRPVLDRVKTALFDILRPELEAVQVLDLYAGTGQVGIEALSQGAAYCVFIDLEKKAIETIKENLARTKFSHNIPDAPAEVRHTDAFSYIRNTVKKFDLIYVAPPQYENLWVQTMQTLAERAEIVNADGLVIVQIDPNEYEVVSMQDFQEEKIKKYGNTMLIFYRKVSK